MAKGTKDKKRKEEIEKVGRVLTEKQKLFCHIYLGIGHKGTFGNATLSYWNAYIEGKEVEILDRKGEVQLTEAIMKNPWTGNFTKEYFVAKSGGCYLLTNPYIQTYMNEIVKDVDLRAEMSKVVKQNDQLNAKVQAGTLLAKLTGELKDDKNLNIPEIALLAESIQGIVGGLKK